MVSEYRIERGDVFYIDKFGFQVGSEQRSGRPAVVVSCKENNDHSDTVEVVYTTTREKTELPTHVTIFATPLRSTVLCEQVTTVSKERIGNYIGRCNEEEMEMIDAALRVSLGLKDPEVAEEKPTVVDNREEKPDDRVAALEQEIFSIKSERDIYKSLMERVIEQIGMAARGGVGSINA